MAKKPGTGKLGDAVKSLFLDKRARAALDAAKARDAAAPLGTGQPQTTQPAAETPHPSQDEINARLDEASQRRTQRAGTPDRQALIEDALRIHADKAKILDDLPEEQKQKLKAMAMMTLMKSGGSG